MASHFNTGNLMECKSNEWSQVLEVLLWGFFCSHMQEPPGSALSVNKANMSTNSTATEEFVCLSGDWNILKVCGREMALKWQTGQRWPHSTLEDSSGQWAGG